MLEEEVSLISKLGADVVRSEFLGSQKGASDGHRDSSKQVSGQLHRYRHLRSRMTALDESESLSDIDDAEVGRYLHSKEEMHYKMILWEEMNKEHAEIRHGKRATEAKKDTPARKASKTTVKVAKEKRLSSKINYDALEKLNAELSQNAKIEGISADSDQNGNSQSNKKFSAEGHKSGRRNYNDEFEQRTDYSEGVDSCRDYGSTLYYGHEDGDGYDED